MIMNVVQELFTFLFAIHFTLIIDRAHRTYNPYDTFNAWKGESNARRRLVLSWTTLHILPLLNFALFFIILGINEIPFDSTIIGCINIVLVGLLSFFDFGYYRIFEGFLYGFPDKFLSKIEKMEILDDEREEFRAHMIPGILYVIVTWLLLLFLLFINVYL